MTTRTGTNSEELVSERRGTVLVLRLNRPEARNAMTGSLLRGIGTAALEAEADPEVRAIVTRRMMQALDVCADLGADQMVVHSPYTCWDYHNLDHFAFRSAYEWILHNCQASMTPVVRRAETLGVQIVIENVQDKDPDIRGVLAASFDSAAVQVSLDTGHAQFAHGSFGAPPVDYFVRRAGAQLAHVHLQDGDGYADRHWPPGEGSVNWAAVFRALGEMPVMPRLILELNDKSAIPQAIDWLAARNLAK